MGVPLTKRKHSNTENMHSLFDAFINHMDGCMWMMMESKKRKWLDRRKNNKAIFILTSLRGNLQWLFCWGPRPCRGIEQCHRWYSSASHSQSGTGFPKKERGPKVTSCLWERVGQITEVTFHLPFWGPCWISFGPWPPVYSSAYSSWNIRM